MADRNVILIVEDERPIREGLRDHLQREGYTVMTAATVADAECRLQQNPELVVLDRRLPDGDGLDVLRLLRTQGLPTPVIVLSALGEPADRIEGLETGADDYVTKPFHLRELLARIQSVLNRSRQSRPAGPTSARLTFGAFVLDVGARRLVRGRTEVPLTRMEFDLLHYFARNSGRAITRNELLDRVWGHDRFPTTRTVDYHVLALRRKIEPDQAAPRHIVTVHRVGYRFEA